MARLTRERIARLRLWAPCSTDTIANTAIGITGPEAIGVINLAALADLAAKVAGTSFRIGFTADFLTFP